VAALHALGCFPDEAEEDVDLFARIEQAFYQIKSPITDDEARLLATLFGPDDCYGMAWSLLHLIETSPGWPLAEVIEHTRDPWGPELAGRVRRAQQIGQRKPDD
jgi:hypothetical protein